MEFEDGILLKSVKVEDQDITDGDLRKINKFALTPLTKDEVFAFKVVMGDNETDDRNFEPFNLNALKDLQKLYIGKTVIKDHRALTSNQVARIYDTELETEPKLTKANEPFTKLVAKCYMVKTETNKDLIAEIKAGIKREVSTGCRPKKLICSICGTDNTKAYCSHYAGRTYDGKTCLMTIDGAKEAYELSFVAIPAQPRAGTTKHYGLKEDETVQAEETPKSEEPEETIDKDLSLEFDMIDSFIFAEREDN